MTDKVYDMSGQEDTSAGSSQLPSDYSSELNRAAPALVSSTGSVRSEATPLTSSSSEPAAPQQASPGTYRTMLVASRTPPPEVPNPVRLPGDAEAELDRRLAEYDRLQRDGSRERSRDRTQHHSISTPTRSGPGTPRRHSPRVTPVAPSSQSDRVSELQGQMFELQRRLRNTEVMAQEHGLRVEQQASAGMSAVYHQEEAMKQQLESWGLGANQ